MQVRTSTRTIDTVFLNHEVSGGDYTNVSAPSVTVMVMDDDRPALMPSTNSLVVPIGTSRVFTVRLNTRPKGPVKFSVEKSAENENVKVTPPTVTFTSSNWNSPKTVRVTAESDATMGTTLDVNLEVDEGSRNRDMSYDGLEIVGVSITIAAPLSAVRMRLSRSTLTVQEESAGNYTVRLDRIPPGDPPGDMTIYLSSLDEPRVGVSPASIPFTGDPSNEAATFWNEPQPVTITAKRDADAVEQKVVLEHRWEQAGPIIQTFTVTVDELDTRGVRISDTEVEVAEGESNTYTVALESAPVNAGKVTVTISSSSSDVTVNPSQLTFTGPQAVQVVTVTSIGDDDAEPNPAVTLSHKVRGADYDNLRVNNVTVTVREDDAHGINISGINISGNNIPMDTLLITEGESETYSVRLTSQPTVTVTVQVHSDSSDLTVRPSQLKFTASDWNIAQTIKVQAEHDDDAENDPVVTLRHTASGGGYNGVSRDLRVAIDDEDAESTKGARVSQPAVTIDEGEATRYTVVLLTQPTGTVRVQVAIVPPIVLPGGEPLTASELAERASRIRVEPTLLTFTRSDWNSPREVRIRAPEDNVDREPVRVRLMHTMSGGGYDDVEAAVDVRIRNNDTAALIVLSSELEIVQGKHQEYTVALATEPTEEVTITIAFDQTCTAIGPNGVTVSPDSLTFTRFNWSSSKEVRVQATTARRYRFSDHLQLCFWG